MTYRHPGFAIGASLVLALATGCNDLILSPSPGTQAAAIDSGRRIAVPPRAATRLPLLQTADRLVPFEPVFQTLYDVYAVPFLFVVTSPEEWLAFHDRLLQQNGLLVAPPPPVPGQVHFEDGEALVIFGMRGPGAAYPVQVLQLSRRGGNLRGSFEIDWSDGMDPIEYSPSDMVRFQGWAGLQGLCVIGGKEVLSAIQSMDGGDCACAPWNRAPGDQVVGLPGWHNSTRTPPRPRG